MAQLPLTNIVTISVSAQSPGAGAYNTSNLGLFTDDAPAAASATISFPAVATGGTLVINFAGNATAAISYNSTVEAIQSAINAVTGAGKINVSGTITGQLLTLTQQGNFGALPAITFGANSLTGASGAISPVAAVTSSGWSGGTLGYAIYASPSQVATDFGSSSKTYQMSNAIFSQQPNILNGSGQLVIMLMQTSVQTLSFNATPTSGSFAVTYNSNTSALISPATMSIPQIQAIVQAVPGLSQAAVYGDVVNGQSLTITLFGVYGAGLALGTTTNTLVPSTTITQANVTVGETIGAAITRMNGVVQFFGVLVNESCGTSQVIPNADITAAAAVLLPLLKIGFFVTNNSADVTPVSGMIAVLTSASYVNTRMLYYGDTSSAGILNALVMAASYAGLALSVNFNGSNTTTTMHLKTLLGVAPDPTMTSTIQSNATTSGADIYASFQGLNAVYTSGANSFYDQIYNLLWFQGALQVAGANYLAQTGTKVPQTEQGMDGLKGAYRKVCEQAVANLYSAAGNWTSGTTFGPGTQLQTNISQRGYYIYSLPVASQLQANRAARQAPLVQIALKQAGAIQSSNVIVNVNA